MNATTPRPRGKKSARRNGAKKGGKLTIREISETADGYEWTTYMVQGFRGEDGKWKRRKFRDRADAEAFVALKSVELLNQDTRLREVVTTLSADHVKEAEAAFNRLRELEREGDATRKHTLTAAVEFYLKHQEGGRLTPVAFDVGSITRILPRLGSLAMRVRISMPFFPLTYDSGFMRSRHGQKLANQPMEICRWIDAAKNSADFFGAENARGLNAQNTLRF